MKPEVFEYLSSLIYRESGIVLPPEKALLLGNRIQKRLRALGLKNETEYLEIIEVDANGEELVQLIDAVSTNVTYFNREPKHFEIYGETLRRWRSQGRRSIKVWCAASSSGEEPYTLAMEALEAGVQPGDIKILATDICTAVLRRAIAGKYKEKALEKLPAERRDRYFNPCDSTDEGEARWQVCDTLSSMVLFKKLNLVQMPYPLQGPIDVIFCRNVMIYFGVKTRAAIVGQCEKLLRKDGLLFLSHSENLLGIQHGLRRHDSSVFIKV